jgi:hypothetical protein
MSKPAFEGDTCGAFSMRSRKTFPIVKYASTTYLPGEPTDYKTVEVPLYGDDRLPLVVTGWEAGHKPTVEPYSVTHRASGMRIAGFGRLQEAKLAVSELLPITDWSLKEPRISYDEVQSVKQRVKRTRTARTR